jgi:hypothetical protein
MSSNLILKVAIVGKTINKKSCKNKNKKKCIELKSNRKKLNKDGN